MLKFLALSVIVAIGALSFGSKLESNGKLPDGGFLQTIFVGIGMFPVLFLFYLVITENSEWLLFLDNMFNFISGK